MDLEIFKVVLILVNMVVTAAVWLYVRNDRHNQEMLDSIKELEASVSKKLESKCRRISQLEADLNAVPTGGDIVRIHERLDDTAKDARHMILMMGEISGQIKQMNVDTPPPSGLFSRLFG